MSGNFQKNHKSEWMCGYAIRPLQLRSWKTALATSNRRDSFPEQERCSAFKCLQHEHMEQSSSPQHRVETTALGGLVERTFQSYEHTKGNSSKDYYKAFFKKKSEQLGLRKSSKTTSRSHEQTGILRGPPNHSKSFIPLYDRTFR